MKSNRIELSLKEQVMNLEARVSQLHNTVIHLMDVKETMDSEISWLHNRLRDLEDNNR